MLRLFQSIINDRIPEYNPNELIEWKERNDSALQSQGRDYGISIEKFMKHKVLKNLKILFGENWDLEINDIKRSCMDRAEQEKEKDWKQFGEKREIEWTEMFSVLDYKKIIEKYWTKKSENEDFNSFEKIFSFDINLGFGSKTEKTKWISKFNSLRNNWAHQASKNNGLNLLEVDLLKKMYNHCEKHK